MIRVITQKYKILKSYCIKSKNLFFTYSLQLSHTCSQNLVIKEPFAIDVSSENKKVFGTIDLLIVCDTLLLLFHASS